MRNTTTTFGRVTIIERTYSDRTVALELAIGDVHFAAAVRAAGERRFGPLAVAGFEIAAADVADVAAAMAFAGKLMAE